MGKEKVRCLFSPGPLFVLRDFGSGANDARLQQRIDANRKRSLSKAGPDWNEVGKRLGRFRRQARQDGSEDDAEASGNGHAVTTAGRSVSADQRPLQVDAQYAPAVLLDNSLGPGQVSGC